MTSIPWIGPAGPVARAVCRPQLEWIQELLREGEYLVAAAYEEEQTEEGLSFLYLLTSERLFSALNQHPGNAVSCWELSEILEVEVAKKRFEFGAKLTVTAHDTSWAGPTHTLRFYRGHADAERFAAAVESARAPRT
ncbi:hypothetical protein [Nocardiopsis nanhaiensis]